MPLESLNNEQINIHNLTIEQEKKKSESQKHYEKLKETYFFDKENGLWENTYLENRSSEFGSIYDTDDQLVGVLAELLFDKKAGIAKYQELKNSRLYDKKLNGWSTANNARSDREYTNLVLLDTLINVQIDKSVGEKEYLETVKDPRINGLENQFHENRYHLLQPEPNGWLRYKTNDQFYELLATSSLGFPINEKYKNIKESTLFDKKNNCWVGDWQDFISAHGSTHAGTATEQLLNILVLQKIDMEKAKLAFDKLKNSKFYDSKQGYWLRGVDFEGFKGSDKIDTIDQLLSVIIENGFEKPNLNNTTPPLPEERNY